MDTILCTGGLGYIGSHTLTVLAKTFTTIIVVDNGSNASFSICDRIRTIIPPSCTLLCYNVDLRNRSAIDEVFQKHHHINTVVHFAALKSVDQSCTSPLLYYDNNINGTLNLLHAMRSNGCKNLVFSSSATVYQPNKTTLTETSPMGPTNPYGQTKAMVEQILQDVVRSDPAWKIVCLRYFNPVGSHESGLIGDRPNGIPSNLFPYIQQVMSGSLDRLTVHGDDYDTPDGTCIRDYVHVKDVAEGHVCALQYMKHTQRSGTFDVFNLGSGRGHSVSEVISAVQRVTGKAVPFLVGHRRSGDVASSVADIDKARRVLQWQPQFSIDDAIQTSIAAREVEHK